MRKMVTCLVTAGLVTLLALPASAAPRSFTYDVTCGGETWVVTAKGTPGFPVEGGSPLLLLGGHFRVTVDGTTVDEWDDAPPPGLASQLLTCSIAGPNEPADYILTVDPAYILPTG